MAKRYVKKGEMLLYVEQAKDLPSGNDPYAIVEFGSGAHLQRDQTETRVKTDTPSWNAEMLFDTVGPEDTIRVLVMDKDIASKDDLMCEVTFQVGNDPGEFEGWHELSYPHDQANSEAARVRDYGSIKLKWSYNYASFASYLIADNSTTDETLAYKELDVSNDMLLRKLFVLLQYLYRAAALLFFLIDNFMWLRPFACLGQLLLVFTLFLRTSYGIDALLPGIIVVLMYYTRRLKTLKGPNWVSTYDFKVPMYTRKLSSVPVWKLRQTMADLKLIADSGPDISSLVMKQTILKRVAYVWITYIIDLIEAIGAVLTWRKSDPASAVYHSALAVMIFVFMFGLPLAYWRWAFMGITMYLFVLMPLYYNVPRMQEKYGVRSITQHASEVAHTLWEKAIQAVNGLLAKRQPQALSPVPHASKTFEEWDRFHKEREGLRQRYHIETPREAALPFPRPTSGFAPQAPGGAPPRPAAASSPSRLKITVQRALEHPPLAAPSFVKVVLPGLGQKFKTESDTRGHWTASHTVTIPGHVPLESVVANLELWQKGDPHLLRCIGSTTVAHGDAFVQMKDARTQAPFCRIALHFEHSGMQSTPLGANPPQQQQRQRGGSTPPTHRNSEAGRSGSQDRASPQATQTPVPPRANPIPDEAMKMYQLSQHSNLRLLLRGMLNLNEGQEEPELLWWYARSCADEGREKLADGGHPKEQLKALYDEGIDMAKRCTSKHPDVAEGWKYCAILTARRGDLGAATEKLAQAHNIKKWALKATELDPSDPIPWYIVGNWYFSVANMSSLVRMAARAMAEPLVGTYSDAIPYLLKSLSAMPTHVALLALGNTYYEMKKYQEAAVYLEQGLQLPYDASQKATAKDVADIKALLAKIKK